MSSEVDTLEIKVEAQARGANSQLDKLVSNMESLSNSLKGVNSSGLQGLANGVSKLASAMQGMSGVKTTDFSRLARNIEKLGNIDTSNLSKVASMMNTLSKSVRSFTTTASADSGSIATLSKNLKQFSKLNTKNLNYGNNNTSSGIKQTASASKTLTSSAEKSGNSLRNLSNRLSRLSDGLTNTKTKTRSLASSFGYFYASCFVLIRVVKSLGNSIKNAADYIEEYNYFNVVTGKVASDWGKQYAQYGYDNAESYGNSFRTRITDLIGKMSGYQINDNGTLSMLDGGNLGLDVTALTNYSAGLMQVTNSLGLTGEASTNTSEALTMLAGDMSSLRNVDLSTAMTNLQSGLIGQSRALYKYGIDITNATLQTYAYKNGITTAVSEMTQAEKMQLRMIAIMDQSGVYAGDLANTINSVANQYRMFKNNITALSRTIGSLFIPVIQKVLPFINGLVIAMQRLFTWVGGLLGIDLAPIINDSGTGYSDAMDDIADDSDNASDAMDGAKESAKELKNELMGFDEINKLSDTSDSSGKGASSKNKGAGSGIDLSDAIARSMADYKKRWQDAFNSMDNKAVKFANDIETYFKRMWTAIEPFRKSVKSLWEEGLSKFAHFTWTALKDFYNSFLVPIGTWAFATEGAGITRLVDVFNELLNEIDWDRLNKSLNEFWKAIEPYAEQFGEGLIDFFKGLGELAVDVINAFPGILDRFTSALNRGNPESARKWGKAFGALAVGLMALKGVGKVIGGIASLGSNIAGISDGLGALFGSGGVLSTIGGAFTSLGSSLGIVETGASGAATGLTATASAALPIVAIAAAIAAGLGYVYATNEDVRSSVNSSLSAISDNLQPLFSFITDTVIPDIGNGFNGLKDTLQPMTDFINGAFTSAWKDILCPALQFFAETVVPEVIFTLKNLWDNVIAPLANLLNSILAPAIQFVADIFTILWKNVIVPLGQYTVDVFGAEFQLLSGIFNNVVIPAINGVISDLQTIWNYVLKPIAEYMQTVFMPVFDAVTTHIGNLVSDLKEIFKGLIEFINGVFSGDWSGAWNGIKDAFDGIWSLISDIAKGPINMAIGYINAMISGVQYAINACISGLNQLSFDVPDWVPVIGGQTWGFDVSQVSFGTIDYLANGGFEDVGQLFVANESGPEMVGTLDGKSAVANQKEITDALASVIGPEVYNAVSQAIANSRGNNTPVVQLVGDTGKIFKVVQDGAIDYTRQTGEPAFPV